MASCSMAQAVKRKCTSAGVPDAKKPRTDADPSRPGATRHLLEQLYPNVETLRQYLLARLPATSRLRRKKIASLGRDSVPRDSIEARLTQLLDTTFVCTGGQTTQQDGANGTRWQQWLSFSQKGDESYVTLSGGPEAAFFSQSEVGHPGPL